MDAVNNSNDSVTIMAAFETLEEFRRKGQFQFNPTERDVVRLFAVHGLSEQSAVHAFKRYERDGNFSAISAMISDEEFRKRIGAPPQKNPNSAEPTVDSTIANATQDQPKQLSPPSTKPDKRVVKKLQRAPDVQRETPPHNIDAEKGVLGSILQSAREAIPKCIEKIKPNFFYDPTHRSIYQSLLDMDDAGDPIDLRTFSARLLERKLLDSLGGPGYIAELFNFVPSAVAVDYYLDIVRENYRLRETIFAATKAVRRAYEVNSADEDGAGDAVLDELESSIVSIRSLGSDGANTFQDAVTEINKAIITPADVIDGVVHEAAKAVVAGASKTYKTFILTDLAISKATGTQWLDFTTEKGAVLYVNCELPEPFFWLRVRAICDERQLTLESEMLSALHLRGRIKEWPQLKRRIPQGKFSLIILDPIYKLLFARGFVRNENDPGPIASLLDDIEVLAMRTGAAVVFGAHYSKGDQSQKEAIDRISGSGIWTRDADSIINLTKHEDFEKGSNECFSVEVEARSHKPREPFVVRWEYPLFLTDSTLDPSKLKKAGRKPDESKSAEKVLKLLTKPMPTAEWKETAEARGISQATFYRRLDELETNGKVELKDDVKWHQI